MGLWKKIAGGAVGAMTFFAALTTIAVNMQPIQQIYGEAADGVWQGFVAFVYENSLPIGMASAFVLGCCATALVTAGRSKVRGAADAEEAGPDFDRLAVRFERMEYFDKLFVAFVSLHGDESGGISKAVYDELGDSSLLDYTVVGEDVRKYRLTDEAVALFETRPSLLGFYEPEGDDEARWMTGKLLEIAESRYVPF